ncbi:MAG TPA: N-acetylmuramoyl-L-alanine amidase [Candidatus Udaeobacter sp.]|nr:N-acetylmuramoyl-L-alanine amidase [Candidatus Udaeobacter sp.]
MVRFRIWLATALAFGAIVGSVLRAQVADEEKSRRDDSREITPSEAKPKKSPSPEASKDKSKKKHSSHGNAEKPPTAIPHAKPVHEESRGKALREEASTDNNESHDTDESPTVRKAKLAKKSDEEETSSARRKTPEPGGSSKSKRRHASTTKSEKKKSPEKEVSKKTRKDGKSKLASKEEETLKPEKTPPTDRGGATASEHASPVPKAVDAAATPAPVTSPEPRVPRAASGERAQVVIEKSGLEEDQGLEPAPSPPPRRGFWPWSRSSANYRYLTRSVIEAIRRAPVKRRRWQFIVVHNSGTRQGNARVFDYYHRHVRRMQNGLAYHFVIGNGTSTGNGQIEVGDRWRRQINGGHVHSDYLNNISLGICLVGDFNRDQPTRAQLDACDELIRYLRQRCGKTERGTIPVKPHREINPPRWPTDCPGDRFPYSWFRRF